MADKRLLEDLIADDYAKRQKRQSSMATLLEMTLDESTCIELMNEDVIEALFVSIDSLERKYFALEALYRLSKNCSFSSVNLTSVPILKAIGSLVGLLEDKEVTVRRYASGLLANLSSNNSKIIAQIVESLGIKALVLLLNDDDALVQCNASHTLSNVLSRVGSLSDSVKTSFSEQISQLRVVEALACVLLEPRKEVEASIETSLSHLHLESASTTSAGPLSAPDDHLRRNIMRAMSALASIEPAIKTVSISAKLMLSLLSLLDSMGGEQTRLTALLFSLLEQTKRAAFDQKTVQFDSEMISQLVGLLSCTDLNVSQFALIAIRYIARINKQVFEPSKTPTVVHSLVGFLSHASESHRLHAAAALIFVAIVEENRVIAGQIGALQSLATLFTDPNEKMRQYAVSAFANIASADENKSVLRSVGAVELLLARLSDSHAKVQRYALKAVAMLAYDDEIERLLVRAGVFVPLMRLLRHPDAEIRADAAFAAETLTHDRASASVASEAGLVEALVALMGDSTSDAVRGDSIRAIGNIANRVVPSALAAHNKAQTGAIPALIWSLRDANSEIRDSAARSLGCICSKHPAHAVSVANAGAIELLLRLLRDADASVRLSAVFALRIITRESANANPMFTEKPQVISALLQVMYHDGSEEARKEAEKALRGVVGAEYDKVIAERNTTLSSADNSALS